MAPLTPKTTNGFAHRVPCPHCGQPNDMRELQEMMGAGFEPGLKASCDHCHRNMVVTTVQPVTIVHVRQAEGMSDPHAGSGVPARRQAPPPQQPQGFFAKLFGAPKGQ